MVCTIVATWIGGDDFFILTSEFYIASRMITLVLGVFFFVLALHSDNLLKLIIITKSFYMPLVSVPFIFSIIGFRSGTKSLIGMEAGFVTVLLWGIFLKRVRDRRWSCTRYGGKYDIFIF